MRARLRFLTGKIKAPHGNPHLIPVPGAAKNARTD